MRLIAAFSFFMILWSCSSKQEETQPKITEVNEIAKEQLIPKQILQELDTELQEEFKSSPPLYSFLPLTVQFQELQDGVLNKPKIQVSFQKGGGQVDLKDIVANDGSFYMSFPDEQFNKESDLLHIFFVSNSPRVKIENEFFGMGCGKSRIFKS